MVDGCGEVESDVFPELVADFVNGAAQSLRDEDGSVRGAGIDENDFSAPALEVGEGRD